MLGPFDKFLLNFVLILSDYVNDSWDDLRGLAVSQIEALQAILYEKLCQCDLTFVDWGETLVDKGWAAIFLAIRDFPEEFISELGEL